MKKWLFGAFVLLNLCSHSSEAPDGTDSGNTTQTTVNDNLPKGWRIEEIAQAAHPLCVPRDTHVLAWKSVEDERPLRIDECLVLCCLKKDGREESWHLVSLYRHPRDGEGAKWEVEIVHMGPGYKGFEMGAWVWHSERFANRPSNKEIYAFMDMDEFRWHLGADRGFKLLGGAICGDTWKAVVKETPTRDFPK
jgi:hypothetical protein